jgi:site-specific DNA-cytosine methylase
VIWGELFAGIRGFGLGFEALGGRTAWASDIDPFCQELMRLRSPGVEVLGDVRLIDAGAPKVDGLAGGFPCQPVSAAGKGLAQADPRWLWPEFFRVICALDPAVVVIENVPMLRKRGMIDVLRDLAAAGFFVSWDGIPAAAVGAPHLRDRVWIVARRLRYPVFGEPTALLPMANVLQAQEWKIPRAGFMDSGGGVFECDPIAPVKTTRRDGWSYWNGVNLAGGGAGLLVPTPKATDGHPTPVARDWKGQGMASQLGTNAALGLWPTPRASSGASISGGGEGGTYYRTQEAGTHGRYLQVEVCEVEAEAGRERGPLNPSWVEWLMGFPPGYTDLSVPNAALEWRPWGAPGLLLPTPVTSDRLGGRNATARRPGGNGRHHAGMTLTDALILNGDMEMPETGVWPDERPVPQPHWAEEPLPRVLRDVPRRKDRLQACGNALLPQIAALVAARALGIEAMREAA